MSVGQGGFSMGLRLLGRNNDSFVINQNESAKQRSEARNAEGNSIKLKNRSLNMSGMNGSKDSVLMRKQLAKKRAMKMIRDAWSGDIKTDMDLDERRDHIKELSTEVSSYNDHIREYKEQKEQLREYYGIEYNEQTEADLELLKRKKLAANNPDMSFTEDEVKRLKELEGTALEKYQEQTEGLDDALKLYGVKREAAMMEASAESSVITSVKLERLKHHKMIDAQNSADKVNEAASRDVIGMLTGEAQDHIDETLEEQREEAKEKAEEKAEQDEKLEEKREEKEKFQEQLDIEREESHEAEERRIERERDAREQAEIIEDAAIDGQDTAALSAQMKADIKDMLHQLKLLDVDIKGVDIDELL